MKTIMLACAAGMSTSMLVTRMKKAAEEEGKDVKIFAVSTAEASDKVAEQTIDAILLGPQVRYQLEEFKKTFEPKGIKVDVIDMTDYGMMNGKKVLETALAQLEK
ncbi:MAG: PTS sugar transporter subunit IIB [Aerococcus sp.]|nr:PTS sugar transporter subunit IIB [Aerococcus sp.]